MKNFFEIYKSFELPEDKREFRNKIIEMCKIQHSTFYAWFVNHRVSKLAQKVISDYLQKDTEILFPKQTHKNQKP